MAVDSFFALVFPYSSMKTAKKVAVWSKLAWKVTTKNHSIFVRKSQWLRNQSLFPGNKDNVDYWGINPKTDGLILKDHNLRSAPIFSLPDQTYNFFNV